MTSPNGQVPEGAYVGTAGQSNSITDLNNLTEAEAKRRMQGGIAPSFNRHRDGVWQNGGLLGHIADLLFGTGSALPAQRLSDGMTELNQRLDLMEDVSGYAGMFLSMNRAFTGSSHKKMPFDRKYGPEKNATADTSNSRVVLAKGTWSVSVLISRDASSSWNRPEIRVFRPDGSLHVRQYLDWSSTGDPTAYFVQIPVVTDAPGYYVEVWFLSSALRARVLGGTDRTKLWVNRWDLRSDNDQVIVGPPDGPDV